MNGSVLPSRGRVTINQVAEAAGVSKASVSRYIGGDRQLLADATARRIERAIDQLDYRPNQMARGLKRGRTRLIGMLVADILNPYSVAVMHGVETACREHGYSLVVCNTDRDDEQERHHLAALQSYNVEGLIVNTLGHHPGELRALHHELPMVLVDRQLAELDTDLVGLDNADAVEQALDHLQHRGFRDILLVTEPLDGTSLADRAGPGLQCLHRPATGAQGPGPANRRLLPRRPARLPFGQRPRAEGAVHLQRRRHPLRHPPTARPRLPAVR